jgi:hypothetical protein
MVGGAVAFGIGRHYASVWESDACLGGNRTREENCAPWRQSAERADAVTVTSWAVGGALLVTAAAARWIAPQSTARRVAVMCLPASAGVTCGGVF